MERSSSPVAGPSIATHDDSSSDDDDDEKELQMLREEQRLAKLREQKKSSALSASAETDGPAAGSKKLPLGPAATSSQQLSYNSDVLFRRKPAPAPAGKGAKPVITNDLIASKGHRDFMNKYFK
jgi:hypothetical protein